VKIHYEAKEVLHPSQILYISAFKKHDKLVNLNLENGGHLSESPLQQEQAKLLEGLPR
jgi:glycine/serine hydroxymethyltransferase